nr:MAG TPA: hypothetical protein [Caudoviricetes sp.]
MVDFKKDELVIRVKTMAVIEDWQDLVNDLVDLMYNEDVGLRGERSHIPVLNLLKELQPEYKDAKKWQTNYC